MVCLVMGERLNFQLLNVLFSFLSCFFLSVYLSQVYRNDQLRRQQNSMFRIIPQENKKGLMKRNILFLFLETKRQ